LEGEGGSGMGVRVKGARKCRRARLDGGGEPICIAAQ
jgi:hypothetical protein